MSALPQAFHAVPPHEILASVWQRNLPVVRERLAALGDVAQRAGAGTLSLSSRKLGADIAHKLAGSLGMFGYLHGTELARALELILDSDLPLTPAELQSLTGQLLEAVPV